MFWQIYSPQYKTPKEKSTNLSAVLPHSFPPASHHNRNAPRWAELWQFARKLRQRFYRLCAGVILASSRFKCQAAFKDLLGHAHICILFISTKGTPHTSLFKLAKYFNQKLLDFHVFILYEVPCCFFKQRLHSKHSFFKINASERLV